MKKTISILHGNMTVGQLSFDFDKGLFTFVYDDSWVNFGFELSPHLTFSSPIESAAIKNFIDNLLPEGDGLELISRFLQISKTDKFSLVNALGEETAGAVTFQNGEPKINLLRVIPETELSQRIKNRSQSPIVIWDKKIRLSLAGVQDKLPLIITDDGYAIGEGKYASTHILKFDKKNEHNIVLNEFFCMSLAKRCGLRVANVEMHRFGDEPVLFVERFDREIVAEGDDFSVKRKHIIDGCQMLNFGSMLKYERAYGGENKVRVGVSFKKISDSFSFCSSKIEAKRDLLRWALFNLYASNFDAHGKNISFFVNKNDISVAPFYDIVNIAMYPDFLQEYAMAYGDAFSLEDVSAYDLAFFCYTIDVNPSIFVKEASAMANAIKVEIGQVKEGMVIVNSSESSFLEALERNILSVVLHVGEHLVMVVDAYKRHIHEFKEDGLLFEENASTPMLSRSINIT